MLATELGSFKGLVFLCLVRLRMLVPQLYRTVSRCGSQLLIMSFKMLELSENVKKCFSSFEKIYRIIYRIPQQLRTVPFELRNIFHFLLHCRDISYSKIISSFHPHTSCGTERDWGQEGCMKRRDFTTGGLEGLEF